MWANAEKIWIETTVINKYALFLLQFSSLAALRFVTTNLEAMLHILLGKFAQKNDGSIEH